jgi:hypothetical protein
MKVNFETERLIIRPLVPDDAEAAFRWCGDPDVNAFMNYPLYHRVEDVRAWLEGRDADDPDNYDEGIVLKATGELIGSGGMRYHRERQNTVLLVTHSMEDIARVADRIVVMHKGDLVMFEPTRRVFSQGERLTQWGLSVPQITAIMQELRRRGLDVPEGVLTVDEAFRALLPLLKKEGKLW